MTLIATLSDLESEPRFEGLTSSLVRGLTGIIAVLVALKAAGYSPADNNQLIPHADHFYRILSFCALTVWCAFAIGIRRRGAAAMIVLLFAVFIELIVVPARGDDMHTIASANLGIVFAYCGLDLFWMRKVDKFLNQDDPAAA